MLTSEGYGPLRIGMTRADVEAALGAPNGPSGLPDPELCDEFSPAQGPQDLFVMIESGRLARISLGSDAKVKTANGVAVGDARTVAAAAYPDAVTEPHTYVEGGVYLTQWDKGGGGDFVTDETARGLRFEINEAGVVTMIHAGGPAIEYVEGCL